MVPGTDPEHWLHRYTAEEWLNAAMNELRVTVDAVGRHDMRAGTTGARRAAGMALNGALVVVPNESWGRTYIEHLQALAAPAARANDGATESPEESVGVSAQGSVDVPGEVAEAARALLEAQAQTGVLVMLQSPQAGQGLLDAARTVMAHAYALIHGSTGKSSGRSGATAR